MLIEKPDFTELEEEGEIEKWYKTSPIFETLVGITIIILAAIAQLIHIWISFPGSIVTAGDFFHALVDSFAYVLQFDLKLWWVFLLIIYLSKRKSVN